MTDVLAKSGRPERIGIWALRILLSGAFVFSSMMKLSGQPNKVAEFDTVGLGQWFRYFTGSLELIGGIAILVPRVSIFGAMALLLVDLGALIAQVAILHVDWIHCVVIGALLSLAIYLQRSTIGRPATPLPTK